MELEDGESLEQLKARLAEPLLPMLTPTPPAAGAAIGYVCDSYSLHLYGGRLAVFCVVVLPLWSERWCLFVCDLYGGRFSVGLLICMAFVQRPAEAQATYYGLSQNQPGRRAGLAGAKLTGDWPGASECGSTD